MVVAVRNIQDEPVIGLRAGTDSDDAECGRIMGLATAAGGYVFSLLFARRHITNEAPLARNGRRRIVAEEDGGIVGFIDFRVPSGHVRNIFVDPKRQKAGIGSMLLTAAEEAIGGDVTATVLAANEPGVQWYMEHVDWQLKGHCLGVCNCEFLFPCIPTNRAAEPSEGHRKKAPPRRGSHGVMPVVDA